MNRNRMEYGRIGLRPVGNADERTEPFFSWEVFAKAWPMGGRKRRMYGMDIANRRMGYEW